MRRSGSPLSAKVSGLLSDPLFRRALGRSASVSAVLLALFLFKAPYLDVALRLWLVAVAAIFVWALSARSLTGWTPAPEFRRRLGWRRGGRRHSGERAGSLEEVEHAVEFSQSTAFDFHYRLHPHLAAVARDRLARHGIQLERQPDRARRLLGDEAWELLRPDRPPPARRNEPGVGQARLRRVVDRLDAL